MKGPARGTTLVELLIVLVLAGVLLGAALPSYRGLIERMQLRAAVNDLFAAIDLTRSQAIARGSRVVLAPLEPAGADWRLGWVVFIDQNANRRPDPSEPRLFEQGPVADGIAISSNFSSGAAPFFIAYNSAGRSCAAGSSLTARWGTLTLVQGRSTRHIKINMLGRVRVCDPQQDAGCGGAADAQ